MFKRLEQKQQLNQHISKFRFNFNFTELGTGIQIDCKQSCI